MFESWVSTPLAAALGWAVLDSLWQGAAIAAALAVALWLLRGARARYAAACAAMAALAAAFGVTLVLEMHGSGDGVRSAVPPALPHWNAAAAPGVARWDLAAAVPWLSPFWAMGVCAFYLRHAAGWIGVRRMRRRGVCAAPERWTAALERLRVRMRVSRPVVLLESCLAEVPVVLGHLRPVILMPAGLLAGLPTEHLEAILAHELAHIRRSDYLVNLVQRAIEGLLFYHPAGWWFSHVIRTERESCCDDAAVAVSGDARDYARALAALEQNRWSGEPAVAATGGNLVKRIRRLLYPAQPAVSFSPLYAAAVLIAAGSLAVTARQEAESYAKWLDEDVSYIIDKQERATFRKLTTDEERNKFIEQFWLRRDPTPGTAGNEFKEEHYRRIAYANRRFGTSSGRPGWQTPRGRTYITHGPPDEIEVDSRRGRETWGYRHIKGMGEDVSIRFRGADDTVEVIYRRRTAK